MHTSIYSNQHSTISSKQKNKGASVNVIPQARAIMTLVGIGFLLSTYDVMARDSGLSPQQTEQFESVIKSYLLKNPEVIREAIINLQKKEAAQAAEKSKAAVQSLAKELLQAPLSPVLGNPKADVTIVEFFDFRCGYCKRVAPVVQEILKTDPNVRVVFKQLPVLGQDSTYAAKAALAAHKQGKYEAFHNALIEEKALEEKTVLALAQKLNLDVIKLQMDIASDEVKHEIEANLKLAEPLGINGTPGFVIGDNIAPGAMDIDGMRNFVDLARNKAR